MNTIFPSSRTHRPRPKRQQNKLEVSERTSPCRQLEKPPDTYVTCCRRAAADCPRAPDCGTARRPAPPRAPSTPTYRLRPGDVFQFYCLYLYLTLRNLVDGQILCEENANDFV
ncbi:hypothetical protein EVAR_8504_1 [Eumeta japonica]|uniref:Uncharacterized protein n=1 Tax=Eumeta variegata TaxID=151549 RepID=A0A4C1TXB4_EUMVA|nr:hypothetical protein EVAR_8504_1 [Eumeta japonica]